MDMSNITPFSAVQQLTGSCQEPIAITNEEPIAITNEEPIAITNEEPIVNPHSMRSPTSPYTEEEAAHFSQPVNDQPVTMIPVAGPEDPTPQSVHTLAEIGNRTGPSTEVIDPTEPKTEKKKLTKKEVALRAAVTKFLGQLVRNVGFGVCKTKQKANFLAALKDYYKKDGNIDNLECLKGDDYLLDVFFGDSPPQLPMRSKVQSEPFLDLWREILGEFDVKNSESNELKDAQKKADAEAKKKNVADENKRKRDEEKAASDEAKADEKRQKKLAYYHRLKQCFVDGTYYGVVRDEWGGREATFTEIKMAFLNKNEDQIKAEGKLCAAIREAKNPRSSKKQQGASGEAAPAEGAVEVVVNATDN